MSLHDRIREARKNKGITQNELGIIIGVATTTVAGYEKNREPTAAQLGAIADALDVDVTFLLQDEIKQHRDRVATPWEMENIIKKYRLLDDYGKEAVTGLLDCEYRRCASVPEAEPEQGKVIDIFPARHYIQSASAGIGDFNDDASYETIDLIKRPPAGMSFLITVDGDSMEPTYQDHDLLFVRAQETIRVGEIGLFVIAGHLYIKEAGEDGLISHNEAYGVIYPPDDTPAKVEGKIIGVCTPDYLQ